MNYEKSFVIPDGDQLNVFMTSDGVMRMQDVLNSPSTPTTVFTAIPNLYANSVTAFSREYIAFHDGFSGQDIPRRISSDMTWQRWTQDGPAVSPVPEDASTVDIPIVSITPLPEVAIVTAVNNSGVITITTATPHGLVVNNQALITGNSVFQYNGPITVATVPTTTTLTYDSVGTGWDEGTGGFLVPSEVTVVLSSGTDMVQGDVVVIQGNSDQNYNNNLSAANLQIIGLASQPVCNFYSRNDKVNGTFDLNHPGDPLGQYSYALPGSPLATYTLTPNQTLMFNPSFGGSGATVILPGVPANTADNSPMQVYGVNKDYNWDGTSAVISSYATGSWQMTVTFNLSFSSAGAYSFQTFSDDGYIFGMGGGASQISGPNNENSGVPHTMTAAKGYPIMGQNNLNNGAVGGHYNDIITVNIPSPGTYPCEVDYCNWKGGQMFTLQQAAPTGGSWSSTQTYVAGDLVTVSGSTYICVLGNLNQVPPNVTYWQVLLPYVAILPASVSGNVTFGTPANWTINDVISPTSFTFYAVYAVGIGTGGTASIGGLVSPGIHQVCMSWLLDDDTITKPSPPVPWTASGQKRVHLTDIPIGPPNVKGRVFNFTGSGGDNFFNLPLPARVSGKAVSTATFLLDNTTTDTTFDFSDNSLFGGNAVDVTGNDLFGQVTLGLIGNVVAYSNRVGAIGNTNKIENMQAMGFEAGNLILGDGKPLGWNLSQNIGGMQVAAPDGWGYAWQEVGTGSGGNIGLIYQSAFEDATDFAPILLGSTSYQMLVWMQAGQTGTQGTVTFDFFSPTVGQLSYASIPAAQVGTTGAWYTIPFNAKLPAIIPSDTVFRTYTTSLGITQTIIKDEMFIVYADEPVNPAVAILWSYAFNAGALHGVTGQLETEYPEPTMSGKILRDNFYIVQSRHLVRTKDNGIGEPTTWTVSTVSDKTGGISLRCFDTGEGWLVFGSEAGLYMCSGGEPQKVSQEVQTLWSWIDPNLYNHVWIKNDLENRRIYVGVPLTKYAPTQRLFTPQSCNKILVVDYRELNTSAAIENAPPLHISMTGKMLSSDLTRKWSIWNLPMNSAEILYLPNENPQICFGSGLGTGVQNGFGNIYQLKDAQFIDDDYGVIGSYNGESPLTYEEWLVSGPKGPNGIGTTPPDPAVWRPQAAYYVSYLSPSHEQEQQLQVGSQRKLYEYLECYVTGVGAFYMLPLINRIGQPTKRPPKPRTMSEFANWDLEFPLNIKAQRMAMLFYTEPRGILPPFEAITISPTTASVATFNTQQFTYTLSGFPDLNVIWSTSGGSITQGGLYTANGTAGTYTVTVTSVDDPLLSATAVVTVHGGSHGA